MAALIVGGGIGGLALAGALAGAHFEVEVLEAEPEWRISASGIALQGPALRALKALDLHEQVLERGFGITVNRHHGADSSLRESAELPRLIGAEYPATVGVRRQALHEVLLERAARAGARVRLGTTVTALEQDGDAVRVRLSDGSEATYGVVVGADGIRSHLRSLLFGAATGPRYTGLVVWRATLARPSEVDQFHLYYSGRTTSGLVPIADDAMYLFTVEPTERFERLPAEREPALMRELLAGYSGLLGTVRDTIVAPEQVVRRPVEAVLLPPPWHSGRAVLIGDAVHAPPPTLAAGGAMVLEDAVVLSRLLREGLPVPDALAAFTDRRWPRCRLVVESSITRGEWMKDMPPDADPAALERQIYATLAAPID